MIRMEKVRALKDHEIKAYLQNNILVSKILCRSNSSVRIQINDDRILANSDSSRYILKTTLVGDFCHLISDLITIRRFTGVLEQNCEVCSSIFPKREGSRQRILNNYLFDRLFVRAKHKIDSKSLIVPDSILINRLCLSDFD